MDQDSLQTKSGVIFVIPYADRNKLILRLTELITNYDQRVCSALLLSEKNFNILLLEEDLEITNKLIDVSLN